jgi:hypothetical protein
VTHVWTVRQDGKDLGTVEAVSRKGACFAAYEKFDIQQSKRNTISVERQRYIVGIDPASPGREGTVYTPYSRMPFGDVVCSFNPALAPPYRGDKTLEDCRQRFETGPFTGSPKS